MLASVCEQLEHIWKPLQITEGRGAEVRRGRAESSYHPHSRSDNIQLLFTISPSEEVKMRGTRGNHLIKAGPPAQ